MNNDVPTILRSNITCKASRCQKVKEQTFQFVGTYLGIKGVGVFLKQFVHARSDVWGDFTSIK